MADQNYSQSAMSIDPSLRRPGIFGGDPSLVSRTASIDPTDPEAYNSQFPVDPAQNSTPPVQPPPQQQPVVNQAPVAQGAAREATPQFSNVMSALKTGQQDNLQGTPFAGLGNLTTKFGDKTKDEKAHEGIDIANAKGTPIPAATSGVVTKVEGEKAKGNPGYGNNLIIRDANGNFHRYSHLTGNYVKVGQPVKTGQVIGGMGDSGNTYSPTGGDASHLDYRIQSAYGKYMNPFQYFKRFRQNRI